jgi:hypothetical protein
MPFASVYQPPRSQVSVLLKVLVLYAPYEPVALADERILVKNDTRGEQLEGLTVPDLDESVVQWGASGSIHDTKIHEERYSPIASL